MRNNIVLLSVLWFATACSKSRPINPEPPPTSHPEMNYIDLEGNTIAFDHFKVFDLDKDGQYDIFFSTMLVGDPINKVDKRQWLVNTSFYTSLPIKNETIPVMNYGDSIPVKNFTGFEWYNASSVVLTQQIISLTQNPYWEGEWRQASHQFLPFQIKKINELFNGWVEISFDRVNEKVVLHKAAISLKANKEIIAGI